MFGCSFVQSQHSDQSQNSNQFSRFGSDFGCSRGSCDFDHIRGILETASIYDLVHPNQIQYHRHCGHQIQPKIVTQKISLLQKRQSDHLQNVNGHADQSEDRECLVALLLEKDLPDVVGEEGDYGDEGDEDGEADSLNEVEHFLRKAKCTIPIAVSPKKRGNLLPLGFSATDIFFGLLFLSLFLFSIALETLPYYIKLSIIHKFYNMWLSHGRIYSLNMI